MQLGANLVYQGAGRLARTAEALGYAVVLAPEGYRSDAPSVLGYVAGQTERIGLVSGVMQIPGRPPGMAALTAATLDALSGGRFRLGLGVSNPDVSEGWYGVAFDEPLERTREYVDVVRTALRGGPVHYEGRHERIPSSPTGAGAPVHLFTEPLRADLPIYLAAVGPRNLGLAGEIADGWIGVFVSPAMVAEAVATIEAGRRRAHRAGGFDVLPCLPTAVADTPAAAADLLRGQYVYLLGIGDPERNLYCALARRLGFAGAVEELRARLASGDRAGAAASLPLALIEATALVGDVDHLAARMRAYAAAGVTTLGIMVSAAATDLDGRVRILEAAAAALDRSGVGHRQPRPVC